MTYLKLLGYPIALCLLVLITFFLGFSFFLFSGVHFIFLKFLLGLFGKNNDELAYREVRIYHCRSNYNPLLTKCYQISYISKIFQAQFSFNTLVMKGIGLFLHLSYLWGTSLYLTLLLVFTIFCFSQNHSEQIGLETFLNANFVHKFLNQSSRESLILAG